MATEMNHHELLKLAAKAAGIQYDADASKPNPESGAFWGLWLEFYREPSVYVRRYWNPLTDNGDAFRLAVKLRLTVSWDRFNDEDYATATPPHTHQGYDFLVDQDPYAAARCAIVLAASEIGKAMQ